MHTRMAKEIDIGKKIADLRNLFVETEEVFGERLGVSQATVNRWENNKSPPARRYQQPIADLAKMTVAEFFHSAEKPRLIPIIGELAGNSIALKEPPKSGQAIGQVAHISLSLGENDQIAVTVTGNSFAPVYRNGDTLIASKLAKARMSKAIGRDCIVLTARGDALIKNVRKGARKGTYTLRDPRLSDEDVEDVELQWAAPIIWIGRAQ